MNTEKLFKFALKQAGIIVLVIIAVPTLGIVALILLSTISSLFCEQLNGLMVLTTVVTAAVLAVKQFHGELS